MRYLKAKKTSMTQGILSLVENSEPAAYAIINGEESINGTASFYAYEKGVIMFYQINDLPKDDSKCRGGVYAFHIHEGINCTGIKDDPYKDVGKHLNPNNCEHPYHLGDLPPIFSTHGTAWSIIYIDKLKVNDIINHTLIIHNNFDDFMTQPSGNAGIKIACGQIRTFK